LLVSPLHVVAEERACFETPHPQGARGAERLKIGLKEGLKISSSEVFQHKEKGVLS
jgi:hypothetical protein